MWTFHLNLIFRTHLQDLKNLVALVTAEFKYRHGSLPFKASRIRVLLETVKYQLEFLVLCTRLAGLSEQRVIRIAEMQDIRKPFVFSVMPRLFLDHFWRFSYCSREHG
jgi:hypothetical protein